MTYAHRQRCRTRIHARTSKGTTTTTMMITGHMGASLVHPTIGPLALLPELRATARGSSAP